MPGLPGQKLLVDATDMAILRGLLKTESGRFRSKQASLEAVARDLGIHPNTVAARVKRMGEGGLFTHSSALPQPNVVGISYGGFHVRLPFAKRTDAILDQMLRQHCIFDVEETFDGLIVWPVAQDDKELLRAGERIRAFLGAPSIDWIVLASRDWLPAERLALDDTDTAILQALAADADAPMEPVAARLGTTARTVQRRLERLRAAEAFRVYPGGHVILTGLAFWFLQCRFAAEGKDRDRAAAILDEILPNRVIRQYLTDGVQYLTYGDEAGELAAQVERAAAVPGVVVQYSAQFRRVLLNPYFPEHIAPILRSIRSPSLAEPPAP